MGSPEDKVGGAEEMDVEPHTGGGGGGGAVPAKTPGSLSDISMEDAASTDRKSNGQREDDSTSPLPPRDLFGSRGDQAGATSRLRTPCGAMDAATAAVQHGSAAMAPTVASGVAGAVVANGLNGLPPRDPGGPSAPPAPPGQVGYGGGPGGLPLHQDPLQTDRQRQAANDVGADAGANAAKPAASDDETGADVVGGSDQAALNGARAADAAAGADGVHAADEAAAADGAHADDEAAAVDKTAAAAAEAEAVEGGVDEAEGAAFGFEHGFDPGFVSDDDDPFFVPEDDPVAYTESIVRNCTNVEHLSGGLQMVANVGAAVLFQDGNKMLEHAAELWELQSRPVPPNADKTIRNVRGLPVEGLMPQAEEFLHWMYRTVASGDADSINAAVGVVGDLLKLRRIVEKSGGGVEEILWADFVELAPRRAAAMAGAALPVALLGEQPFAAVVVEEDEVVVSDAEEEEDEEQAVEVAAEAEKEHPVAAAVGAEENQEVVMVAPAAEEDEQPVAAAAVVAGEEEEQRVAAAAAVDEEQEVVAVATMENEQPAVAAATDAAAEQPVPATAGAEYMAAVAAAEEVAAPPVLEEKSVTEEEQAAPGNSIPPVLQADDGGGGANEKASAFRTELVQYVIRNSFLTFKMKELEPIISAELYEDLGGNVVPKTDKKGNMTIHCNLAEGTFITLTIIRGANGWTCRVFGISAFDVVNHQQYRLAVRPGNILVLEDVDCNEVGPKVLKSWPRERWDLAETPLVVLVEHV